MSVISSKNIAFQYSDESKFSFPDISCDAKESLIILGNSGKGKTTLLHLLSGLIQPTSGEVQIAGTSLYKLKGQKRDVFRGKNIGIVFQNPHFVQSLNVLDNIVLPMYFTGNKIDTKRAKKILGQLNIGDKWDKKPRQLSVGEQQRVTIARALINNPKVLMADEPTSALDDKNANEVIRLLENQAKEAGSALIIVTHDTRIKDKFDNTVNL